MLHPVVLCGGSGTRLWPLSQPDNPKQFHRLVSERSLFQQTLRRTVNFDLPVTAPLVVCNQQHRDRVLAQASDTEIALQGVLLEPVGRNTAPAVAVAAKAVMAGADGDGVMLVLPADHVVRDEAKFTRAVATAYEAAAAGGLVSFGVTPDRAEIGYGYIRQGAETSPGCWAIEEFVEKPDLIRARQYASSADYLWNSGMFMFRASVYLDELNKFAADIREACDHAWEEAGSENGLTRIDPAAFTGCRSESIDYAVMEHTNRAVVVPLDAGWSDVGSWSSLFDVLKKDSNGNAQHGRTILQDSAGCYVHASDRLVAVLGVQDLVVIETDTAVLVAHKDCAQEIKQLVDGIDEQAGTLNEKL